MAQITQPDDSILGLIPIQPKAPIVESLQWVTDITPSYNGGEEPNWMRPIPRQRFRYEFTAQPELVRDVYNTIYGGLVRKWAIPVWSQAQALTSLGEVEEIEVDTTFSDYRVDSPVFVIDLCGNWQYAYIEAVNADSLELDRELTAMRRCFVMPVRVGRLLGMPSRASTGYCSKYQTEFEVDDNVVYDPDAPTQFHGNDIYFDENLLPEGGQFNQNFVTSRQTIDFDIGPVAEFTSWLTNRTSQSLRFLKESQAEAWDLRLWLHRRAGKYRPFWYPSFESDLRPVSTGALTTTLDVALDSALPWAEDRKNIAIRKTDGTWLARRINNATVPLPGIMRLTLESSIAMNASDIGLVSWLGLKRLDADSIDITHMGNNRSQISVQMLEIAP